MSIVNFVSFYFVRVGAYDSLIFSICLAMLVLLAGCAVPIQTGPTEPAATTAPATIPPALSESAPAPTAPPPRSYNGITEGDMLPGELTFYCSCTVCNGPSCADITADGTILDALGPDDYPVAGANWLPLQSLVDVGGTVYRIADCGGPGLNRVGRLDVYTPEGHEAALALGRVRGVEVRIISLPEAKKFFQNKKNKACNPTVGVYTVTHRQRLNLKPTKEPPP
jgi:hypothetical protein